MDKFCKDCKHIMEPAHVLSLHTCNSPRLIERYQDIVTGEISIERSFCLQERHGDWLEARFGNFCGKEGRFFEAREDSKESNLNWIESQEGFMDKLDKK